MRSNHIIRSSPRSIMTLIIYFASLFMTADARKVTDPSRVPKNAILLSDVASLTLRAGKMTSSRRVKAVSQLECVGPADVCGLYTVDAMRCTNEGADYDAESIQWSCKASLPEEFKLGSTEVVCEGYESSDDPYVLKGSCGVEYRLMLTDKGLRTYGVGHSRSGSLGGEKASANQFDGIVKLLFFLVFGTVLFFIIRGMFRNWTAGGDQRRRQPSRGYAGGGGGDDNDPPPPYDFPPGYPSTYRKQNTRPSAASPGRSSAGPSSRAGSQPRSWQPGFWSGALTGAAAGYAANRMTNRAPATNQQNTAGPSFTSRSQSPPSYSAARHESTGFGGTRRR